MATSIISIIASLFKPHTYQYPTTIAYPIYGYSLRDKKYHILNSIPRKKHVEKSLRHSSQGGI